MTWDELDMENEIWTLPAKRTKNGIEHEVPLSKQALVILENIGRQDYRDFVFGIGEGPFSGFSRCKARLDKKCGVATWTLHDLRRTMVTGMNEMGVAPHVVEAVINHVSGLSFRCCRRLQPSEVYSRKKGRSANVGRPCRLVYLSRHDCQIDAGNILLLISGSKVRVLVRPPIFSIG